MKSLSLIFLSFYLFSINTQGQNKLIQTEINEKGYSVSQKYSEIKDINFNSDELFLKILPVDPESLNGILATSNAINGKFNYSVYNQTRQDFFLKKTGKILNYSSKTNSELLLTGLDWLFDNDIIDVSGYSKLTELIQSDFHIDAASSNIFNPFFFDGTYLSVFKTVFTNNTEFPIAFKFFDKIEILSNGNILRPLSQEQLTTILTSANAFTSGKMNNIFRFYLNQELIIPAHTTTNKYFATLPIDNSSDDFMIIFNNESCQKSQWKIVKEVKQIDKSYTFYELIVYPAGNYYYENIYTVILNSDADAYIAGSKLYVNKNDLDKDISILTYAVYDKKLYYFPLKFKPSKYLDIEKKKRKPLPNELIQIKL
jgi:hypothetical protein